MNKDARRAATVLWMLSVALGAEAAHADKILGVDGPNAGASPPALERQG